MAEAIRIVQMLYVPCLLLHLTLVVYLSIRSRAEITKAFSGVSAKALAALALVFLLGLYLRAGMAGRYGLSDLLWEHVNNAQDFYRHLRFSAFTHSSGHSFLVTLAFLFGQDIENVSRLTMLLDSLSIPLVFSAAFLLFKRTGIAVLSALVFALLPWQVFVSGMGLDVTSSLFFFLAALTALLAAGELGSARLLALSLLLLLWAAQIRAENLAFAALFILIYRRGRYGLAGQKLFFPLFAVFSVPVVVWLAGFLVKFGVRSSSETLGRQYLISPANLAVNLQTNIVPHFLSADRQYPVLFFLLLPAGLAFLVRFARQRKETVQFLALWFVTWVVVYGGHWYGSQIYRYSVFLHPVLAIVAGCGAFFLLEGAEKLTKSRALTLAAGGLLSAGLVLAAFPLQKLLRPGPVSFLPSVREFAGVGAKLEDDACMLMQRLKHRESENAAHLIGGRRRFVEWPADDMLFSGGCGSVYYADLREYAYPNPADLRVYDDSQARIFNKYKLETVINEEPLKIYRVTRKPAVPRAGGASGKASVQWVTIEGGTFTMGAKDVGADARPRRVTVPTFQMARTLVTKEQYKNCVDAGACREPDCDWPPAGQKNLPVVCVAWEDAKDFSRWAGGRLASEAEWEYAARSGGRDWKYPWGDARATCALSVISGCGAGAAPVCSKPAGNTRQGLCDMSGNVWEWVADWYHAGYDGAPADGSAREKPEGEYRVNRGGSWGSGADFARAAYRRVPGRRGGDLGFRPARTP